MLFADTTDYLVALLLNTTFRELDDEVRREEAKLKAVSVCPEHGPSGCRDRKVQRAVDRCGRNVTEEVLPKIPGTRFKAETGKLGGNCYEKTHEAMVAPFQRDGAFVKCDGHVENCARLCQEGAPPLCCCNRAETENVKRHKRRNRSAPAQICRCRPFYGTTELEKNSLNAINHLLKAEKELRKVHFTAGSVMPKAQQYVEQVNTIHNDLKQFNTLFRELQKQTNETLEQKGARHFHFVIQGSPTKLKSSPGVLPPR
ncbi:hypothetical protein ANCCAN_21413 [Ancylostoma caninum]|uniref:Uncharacterized protein n=1 Tax=Ancylostoma caninum TaxID=29170 RepID=A0A368FMN2_ANCCA|nr:hypothetical protein ANCCAN_21413 [Ancylostoma caninum]